jgi:hypothetical protein
VKRLLLILATVAVLGTQTWTSTAHAGSNSLFTLGFGAELGWGRHSPLDGERQNSFVGEITARLRIFRILGAQFAYNLASAEETGVLSFTHKFRITFALYLLPTEHVSIYVLGGYGARDIRDLGTLTGATNTYHAGVGTELYIGRRFAITLEYLWLIPGYASMEQAISDAADAVRPDLTDIENGVVMPMQIEVPDLSFTDFLNAGNFQVVLGVRFYI